MDVTTLRIIFMGTPDFAQASLEMLLDHGCNIVAVITAPDKAGGRGMKMQESTIKKFAVERGLHVLQPVNFKNPEFVASLKELNADIQVVVAFRMLPEVVWDQPPMGTINLHASLLPQYRGAAPINWAIINGEKETGVTTFKLQHEIDTGNILLQKKVSIADDENAGQLYEVLKREGAEVLLETLKLLAEGNMAEQQQHEMIQMITELKAAPKISKETCRINWEDSAENIYNLVRGLSPYPGAFTIWNDKILKIFSCTKEIFETSNVPGSISSDNKTYMRIACKNGYIYLNLVQLEGKRRMPVEEFLRGYTVV